MIQLVPALVGAVLLWAGALKLLGRVRRTALDTLVGERFAPLVLRGVGAVEAVTGAALLMPPAFAVEAAAGGLLSVGFLLYLGYAATAAPTSSCGCLGKRHAPIGWRSFARAGGLLVASFVAIGASGSWLSALADRPVAGSVVIGLAFALLVAVSPELDGHWLIPLRKLWVRLTHPLAGAPAGVPLHATVDQLQRSETYTKVAPLLRSDLRDYWDEADWRILTYTASYADQQATAVFAVPRLRDEPAAVRVAMVDEVSGRTLLTV